MDKGQILELIKNGENEGLELKESCPSNNKISENICAFANTDGGFLILGINKNTEIKGLAGDLDKAQQYISRMCMGKSWEYKHKDGRAESHRLSQEPAASVF